ncbi:MAG TPA: hypothetical protein VGK48_15680 [Terriglobia bacterium]|jgi:predicted transcriptional regulator
MKEFKVELPDDLGTAVENAAQAEQKSPEELIAEAVKRDIGRRWMDKLKREGDARRGNLTDDEVDAVANKAIAEYRHEQRSR